MICKMNDAGYCARHGQLHEGPLKAIALDPSAEGEHHRQLWDRAAMKRGHKWVRNKPRMSINQLAEMKCQCEKNKAMGLPCNGGGLVVPTVRNLLFHVWPSSDAWRWNVDQLLQRISLFNGRRIVAVVTDHNTVSPHEVEAAFKGNVDELITLPNIPSRREVVTFLSLWNSIKSIHPSHITFYCHGKGIRPERVGDQAVRKWTEIMYSANLDYWPRVETLLKQYPVVGAFKKVGHGWLPHESNSAWHYSGSFYWFRNRDVFSKPDWQRIDQFWSGIEPWPSLHFPVEQAGCIFKQGTVPQLNLYDGRIMDDIVAEFERWKNDESGIGRRAAS